MSRRMRWMQPAHRQAAPRAAALPTESCDSDAPWPIPARAGTQGRPDPDRVTRMTGNRPDCCPCWPGQQWSGAGPTRPG